MPAKLKYVILLIPCLKTKAKVNMDYPTTFVLRVNEIYHDLENTAYSQKHPEIFLEEKDRWINLLSRIITPNHKPLTIVDIGSGTGFVSLQISTLLSPLDNLIVSDLSQGMLDACMAALAKTGCLCTITPLKLNGLTIGLEDRSVDIMTMNSVLHHIPDISSFFAEAKRILKPEGLIIIGHEPNRQYYSNKKLQILSKTLTVLFCPRIMVSSILTKTFLIELFRRILARFSQSSAQHLALVQDLNKQLRKEGFIQEQLSAAQITQIVDIHSPNAGRKLDLKRGFVIQDIKETHLPTYSIFHQETYNHLGEISTRNAILRKIAKHLCQKYPESGETFFAAFKSN
jgi:ubiquinone/menaquinone biosynthesis C-methylase UbiE